MSRETKWFFPLHTFLLDSNSSHFYPNRLKTELNPQLFFFFSCVRVWGSLQFIIIQLHNYDERWPLKKYCARATLKEAKNGLGDNTETPWGTGERECDLLNPKGQGFAWPKNNPVVGRFLISINEAEMRLRCFKSMLIQQTLMPCRVWISYKGYKHTLSIATTLTNKACRQRSSLFV